MAFWRPVQKELPKAAQGIGTHETRPEAVRRGSVVFRRGCCPRCRPGSRPRGQEKKGTGPVAAFFLPYPPGGPKTSRYLAPLGPRTIFIGR